MVGFVDPAAHHNDPGNARVLVGERDRSVLGGHAGEQVSDPRIPFRAHLGLAHNGHRGGD